jgi:hypothetical protein
MSLTWGLQHLGLSGSELPSGGMAMVWQGLSSGQTSLSGQEDSHRAFVWIWEADRGVSKGVPIDPDPERGSCSRDS